MNDQEKGRNGAPSSDGKGVDAKPEGAKGTFEQMPKAKELSFLQQLSIWILIVIVGALFGMSGSLAVIQGPQRVFSGVSENQIVAYQTVDRKLGHILGHPMESSFEYYIERLKIGRQAEAEGLMPEGKALDKLVDDFLDKEIAPGKTLRDALNEYKGGEYEITRVELRRKIALEEANMAYVYRHDVTPAVPLGVGDEVAQVNQRTGDKVQVDEASLDATSFLKPVDDNDPEIQQTYEKMRASRFTKPEAVTLTVAYTDIDALKKQIQVSDDEAKAWYEAHKGDPDLQKEKPPGAKPETPSEPKPFDEVKPRIIERLVNERALKQAKDAAAALDADAETLEGQKDNAAFKEAAAKKGLAVKEAVTVEAPQQDAMGGPRQLAVPGLGAMRDQAGLFSRDKEPGFISRAVLVDGPPATWAVLRLESRIEAGFKPLSEVRAEVIKHLQGQRAYKDFIAKADAARTAAQKLGPGGLAAYLASPEGSIWNAKVTQPEPLPAAQALRAPPPDLGQPSPETRIAASLAMPDRPVMLVDSGGTQADVPTAKLVQARGYLPGKPQADVAERGRAAEAYRQTLQNFRWRLFQPELQRIREQK